MGQIAGDKNPLGRGHERERIDLWPTRAKLFDVGAAVFEKREIGGLPCGNQNRIAVKKLKLLVIELRRKAALLIVNAQAALDLQRSDPPLVIALNGDGSPSGDALDSFLIAFDDLHGVRRHFLESLQRHETDPARTREARRGSRRIVSGLANHRTGDIISNVAAANDHHVRSQRQAFAKRNGTQEVDAAVNAGPGLARKA